NFRTQRSQKLRKSRKRDSVHPRGVSFATFAELLRLLRPEVRLPPNAKMPPMPAKEFAPGLEIQRFTPPLKLADFKLIAFDMDSTLINIECVDDIGDAVGKKEEIAAITEAAMRGEITDYKESLRRRVALLEGVTVADMETIYTQRLQLNP